MEVLKDEPSWHDLIVTGTFGRWCKESDYFCPQCRCPHVCCWCEPWIVWSITESHLQCFLHNKLPGTPCQSHQWQLRNCWGTYDYSSCSHCNTEDCRWPFRKGNSYYTSVTHKIIVIHQPDAVESSVTLFVNVTGGIITVYVNFCSVNVYILGAI